MKSDRKTKNELIAELEFVHRKVKKLEMLLKKHKPTEQDITKRKRAEEEQQKSKELEVIKNSVGETNEFSDSIIDTVHEPLIVLDQDLRIVRVNRSFYEFFKAEPEETLGQLIYDLGNKQWNIPKLRELLETILPQKASFDNYEVEHDFATIGRRTMLLNARQIERASGKERIILLAIEDITERRKLEKAHSQLAAIVESADDAIIGKDLEGTIVSWNNGAELVYGYSAAEIAGKSISILMSPDHPDEFKKLLMKKSNGKLVQNYETQRRRKDGKIIDVSLTISPVMDISGKIIGDSIIARDITERKEIEAGLEKTRKELAVIKKTADEASEFAESVINTVREPLISLDQDLRVVTVSRSFYDFFKVKPEETVGHRIYDLGNDQWDIPKLRELLETILPQKASFDNYEVEHDFETIGKRTMLLNARQIQRTSKTNERIILLAIEDITERKEIEAGLEKTRKELEAANKELDAFSYSVAHDLRAPLRHLSGYVELLVKHFQSELSEKGVHYLDSIADSTHQMGKLIDTLLQFSKIGRADIHWSQLEMNGIVQEVVETVSKDNPGRTIEWVVRKLPSVSGDDATLRLVWINLLSNAAKFTRTRKNASIEIGANDETKEVIFFVRDNGVGFDMKYAQKLFGVFQRLHSSAEFEGTGVGLANVHRIVLRHGGHTWAEAELDKGATFYFSIPK